MDSKFIAKYVPEQGFKVSIDGFHNLKGTGFGKGAGYNTAIFSLVPPGSFYQETALPDEADFLSQPDKDSPQKSPLFDDGYQIFKDVTFDDLTCLIIDVKRVDLSAMKKGKKSIISVGFAALPIFNEQEVSKCIDR